MVSKKGEKETVGLCGVVMGSWNGSGNTKDLQVEDTQTRSSSVIGCPLLVENTDLSVARETARAREQEKWTGAELCSMVCCQDLVCGYVVNWLCKIKIFVVFLWVKAFLFTSFSYALRWKERKSEKPRHLSSFHQLPPLLPVFLLHAAK